MQNPDETKITRTTRKDKDNDEDDDGEQDHNKDPENKKKHAKIHARNASSGLQTSTFHTNCLDFT